MTAAIPWTDLRADYVRNGALSLKAFAEQHDLPYDSLRRRAKREGWLQARRIARARGLVKEAELGLDIARKVAANAGTYVARLVTTPGVPLAAVASDVQEADMAISRVWSWACRLADFQRDLEEAVGGVEPTYPRESALKIRSDPRWERPTKWPEFEPLAYRARGNRALPRRFTPAKLSIPFRAAR